MTFPPGANLYTQGFGSRPENVEVPHIENRVPTALDTGGGTFPIGKRWIDTLNGAEYTLTNLIGSQGTLTATWVLLGTDTGPLNTLTGDAGGAISPAAGNITLAGTTNQIATSGAGSTITFSLDGPYTPSTYTAHGVLIGEGTSSVVATTPGTTGQVLIGSTGNDPAFGALGVNSGLTAHGVLLGENNSAIVATAAGTTGQVLIGSTGANPAFGALGVNSGLTVHGVLLGENNSAIVATTAGTTGQVLIGSTGADPAFGALGVNSGLTVHGVLIGENNSAIAATTAGTTGQVLIGSTGADPAFGDLGVNSNLTAHGVLVGEGNSAIAALTVGTTGQVLIGSTGADPAFGDLGVNSGLTAHGVLIGEGNSAIAAASVGTTGQVLIGSTGADPAFGDLGVNSNLTGLVLGNTNAAFSATTFTTATAYTPAFSLSTAGDSTWTYTSQLGRYTQMGSVVYFTAQLVWNNFVNTTGSGTWRVSLPVASGAFTQTGQVTISGSGIDASAETANLPVNFVGVVGNAQTVVVLSVEEGGVGNAASALFDLTLAQVKTAGTLNISGFYFAA